MKNIIYLLFVWGGIHACSAQTQIKKVSFPEMNVEGYYVPYWAAHTKRLEYISFVGANYCLPFAQRWWLEGGVKAGLYKYNNYIDKLIPNPNGTGSIHYYEDKGDTTVFIKGINLGVCYRIVRKKHFQFMLGAKFEWLKGPRVYFEPTFTFPINSVMLFFRPYYSSSYWRGGSSPFGMGPLGLGIGCYFGKQEKLFKVRGKNH